MKELWDQLSPALAGGHLHFIELGKMIIQILIITYAIIWTWRRIRGTHAERIVKGLMFIACAWILSAVCGLTLITTILKEMVPVLIIAIVIVFQPELRRGLGYLGRTKFRVDLSLTDTRSEQTQEVITSLIKAVSNLSKSRTGALIVVEPPEGERDYVSPGTTINAEVSSPLLLSIFHTSSPLHDGAVVIRQNKLIAAGVILPVTDNPKLSQRYGTRHRAALGLSEIYDGLCIVVSEETGSISAANRGMLVRYNSAEELADALMYIYHQGPEPQSEGAWSTFIDLFKRRKPVQQASEGEKEELPYRRRSTDFPKDERLDQTIEMEKLNLITKKEDTQAETV